MHDIRDMFATLAAGFIFLAVVAGSSIGLWYALTYNHIVTVALVALYGVVQMSRVCVNNPKQSMRGWWVIFWFNNEWYKLVLLFTGMWTLVTWV